MTALNEPGGSWRSATAREALRIVEREHLQTVRGSLHYSWDLERFYSNMYVCERGDHLYVFHHRPIHEWAPAPVFSNDRSLETVLAREEKQGRFWQVSLTDFDSFLRRRSLLSRSRHTNFPTAETYARQRAKIRCTLERKPLRGHEREFISYYDALKHPKYGHSGEACLAGAALANANTPKDWFAYYLLRDDATTECRSIALVIDDGTSCSGVNTAASRHRFGYGTFLIVEIVKALCSERRLAFDAGISERYGTYKDKIFLDALPIGDLSLMPFERDGIQGS